MRVFIKVMIIALGALIGMILFLMPSLDTIAKLASKREVVINDQTIIADVVTKPADMERGLGGRDHLGINEGMLFLFKEPGLDPFWMKDMKFPIDILWLKGNTIVGITENIDPQIGAPPSALKLYYPPEPVTRVLELAAGRARLLHATVGIPIVVRALAGSD